MPARKPNHVKKRRTTRQRKDVRVVVHGEQQAKMSAQGMAEVVMMLARQLKLEADEQAGRDAGKKPKVR